MLAICVLAATCLGINTVEAQVGVPMLGAGVAGIQANEPLNAIQSILSTVNVFVHILLLVILNMLQYLLQADFFNEPKMMSALNAIWVLSRNIMNIVFAIMLIGVAFYTIITAKAELIKGKWSQFAIAVVLVNFSWFFPRVIIDVANVLTATVYSVPGMLPASPCLDFNGQPCTVITNILIMPDAQQEDDWTTANCPPGATCRCPLGIGCYKIQNYDTFSATNGAAHAMLNGMATTFMNIATLTQIPAAAITIPGAGLMANFQTTIKIVMNIMMVLFVQLAIVLPLIGLGVGLLVRILILWVAVAFMPFTFLGYVITGKLGTNVFGFEINLWDEFINAAFLPVVVAVPFVIGFIMLTTVAKIPAPPGYPQEWGVPLINGVTSWWAMLWLFAAVGIIYVGAFTALARSKITGKFTEKLKGFGDMAFGAALQLPLITPLPIGLPGGKQGNLGTLFNAPKALALKIRQEAQGDLKVPGVNPAAVNSTNLADALHTQAIVTAIDKLRLTPNDDKARNIAFREITTRVGGENLTRKQLLEAMQTEISQNPATHPLRGQLLEIQKQIRDESARATDKSK